MKLISIFLLSVLLVLCFSNCNNKFEREKELIDYLTNVHEVEFNNSKNIVILQSGFCGACTDAVVNFVLDNFKNLDRETIIILTSEREDLVEKLETLGEKSIIKVGTNRMISKYGLRYSSDIYFRMEGTSIKFWSFIKEENLKSIKKYLK